MFKHEFSRKKRKAMEKEREIERLRLRGHCVVHSSMSISPNDVCKVTYPREKKERQEGEGEGT